MKKTVHLFFLLIIVCSNADAQKAFEFNGSSQYITFGVAPGLGSNTFTLECWFYRKGAGGTTSTGTGGITDVIPLVSKGRGEADGSTKDMNYLLGIQSSTNKLCADFEEGTGQPSIGLNHPVFGNTTILNNTWYHAAVTFDGKKWKLYLNGILDGQDSIGVLPQSLSIQHAGIASAMTSTGVAQGYFQGVIDEVRIWNIALTEQQLKDSINKEVTTANGLVGRWAMDDVSGTTLTCTGSSAINGTRVNGPTPVGSGAPYNIVFPAPNFAPAQPTAFVPAHMDTAYSDSTLNVMVTDPELDNLKVTFIGREHLAVIDSPSFAVIPIPDTQYYTSEKNGGRNTTFKAQTQWVLDSMKALNIAYVVELGDCVENGDNGGDDIEWKRADTAIRIIEDPLTTKLTDGIPYGICVGNHDQSPIGTATGTTAFYNQFFGSSRFTGRAYYGGHYGNNNDNHYQLFSASGFDFIALNMEYDTNADTMVLHWADSILKAYPKRRGIISSHWIINSNGTWGAQGQAIYNWLKNNPNLDIMLCGHVAPNGEARRTDVYNKHTTHTLLSDFQDRTNGGDGWMRIMQFYPGENRISVKTYSPKLDKFETDANSQFSLDYQMTNAWDTIAIIPKKASGSTAAAIWNGLKDGHRYDWYVVVEDTAHNTTTSAIKTFTYRIATIDTTDTTDTTTGIKNAAIIPFDLFPNPNDGQSITISYGKTSPAAISITDAAGKLVYKDNIILTNRLVLPLKLDAGYYLVTVLTENRKITRKLIVR